MVSPEPAASGWVASALHDADRRPGQSPPASVAYPRTSRRRFTTSDPTEVWCHDHVAWCGEAAAGGIDRVAVAAFSGAARRAERMVLVCDRPHPDRLAGLEDLEGLLHRGALTLAAVDDVYGEGLDVVAQRAVFERMLDAALAEGYAGLCVVADNTRPAAGSDEEFAAWLHWEVTADRFQATRPVTGICYFDAQQVPEGRRADLAALHPVLSAGFEPPSFQFFVDGEQVRVVGVLESMCAGQLGRILRHAPALTEMVLDLSDTEFVDHRALLVLNRAAGPTHRVHLRGAKAIVRRVWDLLDVADPKLEFC